MLAHAHQLPGRPRRPCGGAPRWLTAPPRPAATLTQAAAGFTDLPFRGGTPAPLDHLDAWASGPLLANPDDGTQWIAHLAVDRVGLSGTLSFPVPQSVLVTVTYPADGVQQVRELQRGPLTAPGVRLRLDVLNTQTRERLAAGWTTLGSNPERLTEDLLLDIYRRRSA